MSQPEATAPGAPTAHDVPRVTVIIPALDEEGTIGTTVTRLDWALIHEVIVVDNGSADRTAERAKAAGARVVLEQRRGYGSACSAGVRAAVASDVLVFLDGDGSDVPEDLPRILGPVLRGEADLVLGSRTLGEQERGSVSRHQLWGNRLVIGLLGMLTGVRLTDFGPFRAIRTEALRQLDMSHPTYGWPIEMVVKAIRRDFRILEVPVRTRRRMIGRSKVAGTVRGSLLAGYHLLVTVVRYAWGPNP
ncbi:MAG TPA: glycosyltransferase family 2 protein [Candidatus Methylomirabilis sp.]|nr:glycosyltransferase family 2 protein [Candidatus Methylomirabilis sp.]